MADDSSAMRHHHGMRDLGRKRGLTVRTVCQSDSQLPFSRLIDNGEGWNSAEMSILIWYDTVPSFHDRLTCVYPRILIYWNGHHIPLSFYLYTAPTCSNAESTHKDCGSQVSINMP